MASPADSDIDSNASSYLGRPKLSCPPDYERLDSITSQISQGSFTYLPIENGSRVLEGLNELRQDGQLCDITLVAEDQPFRAHKVILASYSEYFRSMFTGGMKESQADASAVILQGVTARGLEALLDAIYTSKVPLRATNISDVIAAASYLQMPYVLEKCCDYMISELTLDNCTVIFKISGLYDLAEVKEAAEIFIRENFKEVSKTDDFKAIAPEILESYIGSPYLGLCTELDVFHSVNRWINHDRLSRLKYAGKLISHVRLALISPCDIRKHVQPIDFMKTDQTCLDHLLSALNYHLDPFSSHCRQAVVNTQLRTKKKVVVAVGGRRAGNVPNPTLYYLDEVTGESVGFSENPQLGWAVGVAVIDNFLFVCGGQHQTDLASASNEAYRYDPRFNEWTSIMPMKERRTDFALISCNGSLYAINGHDGKTLLNTVEVYSPRLNKWQYMAPLDTPCYGHAATVHLGKIYISGGYTNQYENTFRCYDVASDGDSWHELRAMETSRGWHAMATIKDKIVVIGGRNRGNNGYRMDVRTLEVYNPKTDQWSTISNSSEVARCSSIQATVLNNKIYILGGYCHSPADELSVAIQYDPEEETFSAVGNLPCSMYGVGSCVLSLPETTTTG